MTPEHMTYRRMEPTEWHLLEHEFAARNVPLPNPAVATIFGAFDYLNKLQAFMVCQMKFHSEPLVSYNPVAVRGLVSFAENAMAEMGLGGIECYIATSQDRVRELVWALGFHPAEPMFVKRLKEKEKEKGTV